jgi:hypothetical protein
MWLFPKERSIHPQKQTVAWLPLGMAVVCGLHAFHEKEVLM